MESVGRQSSSDFSQLQAKECVDQQAGDLRTPTTAFHSDVEWSSDESQDGQSSQGSISVTHECTTGPWIKEEIPVARTFVHFPTAPELDDDSTQKVHSAPPVLGQATTIRARGLPIGWRRNDLAEWLVQVGFKGCFDFIYMPVNFRNGYSFGYAFVNMVSHFDALMLVEDLRSAGYDGAPAKSPQGLTANVEKWKNTCLMHADVPQICRPALYDEEANTIEFPAPTRNPPRPHIHGEPFWISESSKTP